MSEQKNKPIVPWVVLCTGLICAVLLPFRDFLPLNNDFVSRAFTGEYGNIPLADLTFVSYMFQHENIFHLGWNLIFFWWLGSLLENAVGHERTALFIIAVGVGAGLVNYFADPYLRIPVIGLSGVDFGLLVALAMAAPLSGLGGFPFIPVCALAVFSLGSQVLGYIDSNAFDKTAYWIHFGGSAMGFLLWAFWLRKPFAEFKATEFGRNFLK